MEIKEITSKETWQKFFNEAGSLSFLQSWEWGEFEEKMGYTIMRLSLYDKNELQAIALVMKIKAKRGNFLFIPHGPVVIEHVTCNMKHLKNLISQFLNFLISLAKKENFVFIRFGPILENSPENQQIFKDLAFRTAPIYLHSENFWILPLEKSEDELMATMRKTTRYLIKKAVRDGVTIEKSTDIKALDVFYEIYKKTVEREHFSPYPKEYIKKEFEAFHKEKNALFLFGRINSEAQIPVSSQSPGFPFRVRRTRNTVSSDYFAAALILFTKAGAFYHQGASIHSKIPVPYLLQWEAIKEAKRRGCKFYNFWGVLIKGRTPRNWEGLTTFKTGFGGYEYQCVPTQDYIISPKYYLTYFYETFLQWKRGV